MSNQKKLENFSVDELLLEVRKREAQKQHESSLAGREALLIASSDATTNDELEEFDTATLIEAVQDSQKAIYGVDDRAEIFEITDQSILKAADGVVALFKSSDISDNGDGTSTLVTSDFATRFNLCSNERFRKQPVGAFCTGFLVAPDVVATAAHCITADNVTRRRFVFGFRMKNSATAETIISNTEIYSGQTLIERKLDGSGTDWALVRLDRAVTNHTILKVRKTGRIADAQSVYVIGHPCGLPAKFAPGASVRDNSALAFFQANLDTYGGNSGSPVFNSDNFVEGILVRGETDFASKGDCMVSLVCPTTGCQGEDCTRATEFAHLIPEV